MKTAVEWLMREFQEVGYISFATYEQAKEMEKEQKIDFACDVYDKYNFGPQEISFREECETFKQE